MTDRSKLLEIINLIADADIRDGPGARETLSKASKDLQALSDSIIAKEREPAFQGELLRNLIWICYEASSHFTRDPKLSHPHLKSIAFWALHLTKEIPYTGDPSKLPFGYAKFTYSEKNAAGDDLGFEVK